MPSIQSKINPDLEKERENCNFNIEEFAIWWNGGQEKLIEKRAREEFFFNDPEFQNDVPECYMSHKELYENSIKKSTKLIKKIKEFQAKNSKNQNEKITLATLQEFRLILSIIIGSKILPEHTPIGLHFSMFLPTILNQGTPEQQEKWLTKGFNCNIIGTYAQTELGHGTFLRGLETRADYDMRKQEFVLNSPSLTAYKWWPGGLAHTANYAIVLAQLYTSGISRGLQPFIIQLRDEETHKPMRGIKIGEIGSKLSMNATNNGYLGLRDVRIPRTNMLMANSQVLKNGKFIKSRSSVLTYSTMMFVRVNIVRDMGNQLSKACTIATRYSAIRRQSPIDPSKPEPQIMDHITQQLKLFPQIAKAMIFKLTADFIWNMYSKVNAEVKSGNLISMPEMHALSCCLKAICSADTTRAVEVLRMSCGGHGYMNCSNFPSLYGLTAAACTYEGENTVMLLQTARFLIKSWAKVLKDEKLTSTVEYLEKGKENYKLRKWDGSVDCIIQAFEICAANKIRLAFEHLEEKKNLGYSAEEAANMTGIEMTDAAELHCRAFLLSSGLIEVQRISKNVSSNFATILRQLLELYAIDACLNRLGDILRFIDLTERDINDLRVKLEKLLALIRPNAVGIVDGFDIHDALLNSALGAYDGNVYERMFAEAQKSPLNQESVNKSFNLYLKPFMKSSL